MLLLGQKLVIASITAASLQPNGAMQCDHSLVDPCICILWWTAESCHTQGYQLRYSAQLAFIPQAYILPVLLSIELISWIRDRGSILQFVIGKVRSNRQVKITNAVLPSTRRFRYELYQWRVVENLGIRIA